MSVCYKLTQVKEETFFKKKRIIERKEAKKLTPHTNPISSKIMQRSVRRLIFWRDSHSLQIQSQSQVEILN